MIPIAYSYWMDSMDLPLDSCLVLTGIEDGHWFDLYAEWLELGVWEAIGELRRN